MKLELASLRVKNCGPLRDVCIHFDRDGKVQPVTVLAGANGCGKTTALELIYAVANAIAVGFASGRVHPQSTILKRSQFVASNCLIDGEPTSLCWGGPFTTGDFGIHRYLHVRGTDGELSAAPDESSGNIVRVLQKSLVPPNYLPLDFRMENLGLFPSVLFFPHSRFLHEIKGEQLNREPVQYEFAYRYENIREFKGSLDSYFCWLEWSDPSSLKGVFSFLHELDIDGKRFSVDHAALKAVVQTRSGEKHYLEHLSSGEQNILIMLLELRRRLIPGSIVLIDEIENSLHPAFQHRLAQSLLKLQQMVPFQLIVTTHAPAFVEIFGPENTRIMTEF